MTLEDVVNKIEKKIDFTIPINHSRLERYTVGQKNIFTCDQSYLNTNTWFIVQSALDSGNELLGGWLNKETGVYYLDYGKSIRELDKAKEVAKTNKQIAIYDNVKKQVIEIV